MTIVTYILHPIKFDENQIRSYILSSLYWALLSRKEQSSYPTRSILVSMSNFQTSFKQLLLNSRPTNVINYIWYFSVLLKFIIFILSCDVGKLSPTLSISINIFRKL